VTRRGPAERGGGGCWQARRAAALPCDPLSPRRDLDADRRPDVSDRGKKERGPSACLYGAYMEDFTCWFFPCMIDIQRTW
jgi:hypothetical protein